MSQPRTVTLNADGGLSILWDDGHRSVHSGAALRLACGCAMCRDEWSGEPRIGPGTVPGGVTVRESRPVGRYGLQLTFSDGHGTGIFTFDRLRAVCECEACRTNRAR